MHAQGVHLFGRRLAAEQQTLTSGATSMAKTDDKRGAAAATAEPTRAPASPGDVTVFRRPGEIVGNYRVLRLLARGGLSEVYLGENCVTGTQVAIKVLAPLLENRPDLQKRLKIEAQIGDALAHPNIVRMKDAGMTADHRLYIVMDYVPGRTLREQIELPLDRRIDLPGSLHIMLLITAGVRFAHRKGIYHRDLKPENIIVIPGGDVKIVDFGIAKYTQLGGDDSKDLPKLGTLRYLSPEQIRGEHVDGRSDIYALGIMFYEMYGGRHPYELPGEDATDAEMMARHLSAQPVPLPELIECAGAGAAWDFIKKCIAKNPTDRWTSADEMLEALCELARLSVPPEHPEEFRVSRVVRSVRERAAEAAEAGATRGGPRPTDDTEPGAAASRPPMLPDAPSAPAPFDAAPSAPAPALRAAPSAPAQDPLDAAPGQRMTEPAFVPTRPVLPFVSPQSAVLGKGYTKPLLVVGNAAPAEPPTAFAPAHGDLTPTPIDRHLHALPGSLPNKQTSPPTSSPRTAAPTTKPNGKAPPAVPPNHQPAPTASLLAPAMKAEPRKESMVTDAQPHPPPNTSMIVLGVACGASLAALFAVAMGLSKPSASVGPPTAPTTEVSATVSASSARSESSVVRPPTASSPPPASATPALTATAVPDATAALPALVVASTDTAAESSVRPSGTAAEPSVPPSGTAAPRTVSRPTTPSAPPPPAVASAARRAQDAGPRAPARQTSSPAAPVAAPAATPAATPAPPSTGHRLFGSEN